MCKTEDLFGDQHRNGRDDTGDLLAVIDEINSKHIED